MEIYINKILKNNKKRKNTAFDLILKNVSFQRGNLFLTEQQCELPMLQCKRAVLH